MPTHTRCIRRNAAVVSDRASEHRYEIAIDGEVLGFTLYRSRPGLIAFIHTAVDARHEGEGLGIEADRGRPRRRALRGLAVVPFCPFVKGYIARHREYVDLVPVQCREEFGL